ncbi:probable cytochrome P450 6a13 [Condylostylus longicornis]|uniref:probable cytochrome P450 6a13 n=1 Tax=Condylostylus longicornis TaxID=2530218 RepID=UPI00244E51BA|nr:probable cytochrome P450 6a13 [Condylostylus longicornis]
MYFIVILATTVLSFITFTYLLFKNSYRTWEKLKVPYVTPKFPFGNFNLPTKSQHFGIQCHQLYEKLKGKDQYAGIYLFKQPNLLALHPDFVKLILVDDFNTFNERGLNVDLKHDPITENIYFLSGSEWRNMKQKLLNGFTSNRMRTIFKTLSEVGEKFEEYLITSDLQGNECNIKDIMTGYTADVLSSCLFGTDGDSIGNTNSEFCIASRKLLMNSSKYHNAIKFWAIMFPETAKKLGYCIFDKQSTKFFEQMLHKTIGFRKENNLHRNDILQTMIELMDHNDEYGLAITFDEVIANIIIFFYTSYESCTITMSYVLYQLAQNRGIQTQLRWEIEQILNQFEGKLNYDSLGRMQLLERVILESLRMHPPIPIIQRIAKERYQLPNGSKIPRGTHVLISVLGIHYDSELYPNPNKFDPDRFIPEIVAKRHPYSYLPFGEGPRICIGQRLAMLIIKIGLVSILRKYSFDIGDKTQIPLKIDTTSMTLLEPENGIWLKLNADTKLRN